MLTFGVKLHIEHVGRAGDGGIPRGTTQFPDPTDVDITNVINAVWLQIKRFNTPSMPGAQVQADSPTQRAFLMGEEKWKGTENGGSMLKGSLSLSAGLFTARLRAPITAVLYKKWQDALRTRAPPAKEPQASSPSPKATTQTRGQPRCSRRSQLPSYETWRCNLKFTSLSHAERTTECALSSHEAPSGNKSADAKQQQPRSSPRLHVPRRHLK